MSESTNVLVAAIAGIAAFFIASQVKKEEKTSQQQALPEQLRVPESVELPKSKLPELFSKAKDVAEATRNLGQSSYYDEDRRSLEYKQKIGKQDGGYF